MILRAFSFNNVLGWEKKKKKNYEAHFSSESFPILMCLNREIISPRAESHRAAASPLCFIALRLIHWVILKWWFSARRRRHNLTFCKGITNPRLDYMTEIQYILHWSASKWALLFFTPPFLKGKHEDISVAFTAFDTLVDLCFFFCRILSLNSGHKLLQQMENNGNKSPHFHL